jgi:hypothetical protein
MAITEWFAFAGVIIFISIIAIYIMLKLYDAITPKR